MSKRTGLDVARAAGAAKPNKKLILMLTHMIAVALMGFLFGIVWHDRPAREKVRVRSLSQTATKAACRTTQLFRAMLLLIWFSLGWVVFYTAAWDFRAT
jgi:hypothetical protein